MLTSSKRFVLVRNQLGLTNNQVLHNYLTDKDTMAYSSVIRIYCLYSKLHFRLGI